MDALPALLPAQLKARGCDVQNTRYLSWIYAFSMAAEAVGYAPEGDIRKTT
jgi:hypothetical protein